MMLVQFVGAEKCRRAGGLSKHLVVLQTPERMSIGVAMEKAGERRRRNDKMDEEAEGTNLWRKALPEDVLAAMAPMIKEGHLF
jgi:hypothetical protein